MKYIIIGILCFCLGLLTGIYESDQIFNLFSNQPKLAIILGLIIAGGIGYVVYIIKFKSNNADKYSRIGKIDTMREKGQLTQEEFEQEKKKILENLK